MTLKVPLVLGMTTEDSTVLLVDKHLQLSASTHEGSDYGRRLLPALWCRDDE
jgi:hypothetical protein